VDPLSALANDARAQVSVREAAAQALGATCLEAARDPLAHLVETGSAPDTTPAGARVGAAALHALARFDGEAVTEILARAADGRLTGLRLAAIEALGLRGDRSSRQALERLSRDAAPAVSAAAATALRRLDAEGSPAEPCRP
jgi:HEAT repeat protein